MVAALRNSLFEPGHGWVYSAPIGIEFPDSEEGVQPDIVFVSRGRSSARVNEGIRGAPDLVVEIISPSTAERDRTIKQKLYRRQGVRQYWIVDPDAEMVEVWDFEARARGPARYLHQLPVRLGGTELGTIELPEIFAPDD